MSAAAMDAAVSRGPSLQEIQLVQGHVRRCQHHVGFRNLLLVLIVQKVGEYQGVDLHVQRKTFGLIWEQ